MSKRFHRFAMDQEERVEGYGDDEKQEILENLWKWLDSETKAMYNVSMPKDKGKEKI